MKVELYLQLKCSVCITGVRELQKSQETFLRESGFKTWKGEKASQEGERLGRVPALSTSGPEEGGLREKNSERREVTKRCRGP